MISLKKLQVLSIQTKRQLAGIFGIFPQQIEQIKIGQIGQPRQAYPIFFPGSFLSIHFCSGDFLVEFSFKWFAFRKFNSFRNFWKHVLEFSVPFASVSKFSKGLVEWKAPLILCAITFIAEKINNGEVKADWSNISSCSIRLRNKVHQ